MVVKRGVTANTGGTDATEQSQTRTRYFRGMSGDAGRATITVKDSTGTETLGEDLLAHRGRAAEAITYTKASGSVVARELTWPYAQKTASRAREGLPALEAHRTGTARTDAIQTISGGRTRTVRALTTYDSTYGLPLTGHALTLTPDASGTQATGNQSCTTTSYVHNTTKHLIGLSQRVRTTVGDCAQATTATGNQIISDSRTSYDALAAFGTAPVKGLPFQVDTVDGAGTGWITSARSTFDALGRVTKVTDAAGNSLTTAYTPATGPAFEASATNAAGHTATSVTDPARGTVLSVTDPNSRKTTSSYDELGRITGVWSPSRTQGADKASALFEYQIADNKAPVVTTRTLRDNGTYEDSVAIFDGLLRPRQTQTEALSGGRIVTDTLYSANGTPRQTNNGYYAEGEPGGEIFVPETVFQIPNSTETAYDGLGRAVLSTTLYEDVPQHSSTVRYEGDWTLTRTGMSATGTTPLSGSRAVKSWTDTLGRTSLIQHFTATDLTTKTDTSYVYDPRGKLAQVTDDKGNNWTYTYDARGRMTASTDPDMGSASFAYNALDQQTRSTDGQGRTQHTAYDVLGRQTELRDDSTTGPLVAKWTYDSLPGAVGYPVSATRYNGGAAFTSEVTGYDTEYRPTGSKITIPTTQATTGLAGTYAYASTYTATGKLQTTTLPATPGGLASEKLITRYNGEDSPVTTSGLSWYTADTRYSPYGEVLRTASGEAPRRVWTTNLYNANTGRVDQSVTDRETANPDRISALTYGYDTVGNVTSITDTQSSTRTDRQCYSYDPMGRLVHAWTGRTAGCPTTTGAQGAGPVRSEVSPSIDGGGYWQSFAFDTIGNRTGMTVHDLTDQALDDVHTYTYGTAVTGAQPPATVQPHTLAKVDSTERTLGSTVTSQSTYAYDSAGNTTQRVLGGDTQALTWDRRNKLTSVDTDNNGTANVTYLYDASGNRLIEDNGTTRTLFLGEAEITVNTVGTAVEAQRYYTHPGAPTTVRSTGGKATGHKLTVLLTDHHNTATNAIDQTVGQAITRRKFDPYGNPRGTEPTNWPGRHTFLGTGIDDPTTGLTHIGAREYDASTGRFISADPLIDITDPLQMNGYTYANGNPVSNSDPTGLINAMDNSSGNATQKDITSAIYQYETSQGTEPYKAYQIGLGYWNSLKPAQPLKKVITIYPGWTIDADYPGAQKYVEFVRSEAASRKLFNTAPTDDLIGEPSYNVTIAGLKRIACSKIGICPDGKRATFSQWAAVAVGFGLSEGASARGPGGSKPSSGGCKCFLAGTDVLMANGTIEDIEDIKLGDKVQATDPETGETGARTVTRLIVTEDDKNFNELSIATEDGIEKLTATHEHPFWSPSANDWIEAGNLQPGMTLLTDDGATVIVTANRPFTKHTRTYNLTVDDLHTYYVLAGETPVLVHNSNGICGTGDPFSFRRTEALSGNASKRNVDSLTASMKENGWQGDPISVAKIGDGLYVLDGHHRVAAAKRAGVDVPYRILPEAEIRARYPGGADGVTTAWAEVGPDRLVNKHKRPGYR